MRIKVYREDGVYDVMLLRHKIENKWSFVNLTKGHICPCKFNSVEDAVVDLKNYINKGKIIKYLVVED